MSEQNDQQDNAGQEPAAPKLPPPFPMQPPSGFFPPDGIAESDEDLPADPDPSTETLSTPPATEDIPASSMSETDVDDTPVRVVARGSSEYVTQPYPVFSEIKEEVWNDNDVTLVVPAESRRVIEQTLESMAPGEQQQIVGQGDWVEAAGQGMLLSPLAQMNDNLSADPSRNWNQTIQNKGGRMLEISRPKINDADNAILRGTAARLRMRAQLGMGTTYRIPLWHSGLWITLRSPSDGALLELDRKLTEDKTVLGRQTSGLMYSNASVFLADPIMQFAMDHLVSSTFKNPDPDEVRKRISVHDIQQIAWGLACAVWPNGFQYVRAILGSTPKENRVVKGKISVSKLQYVDHNMLSEKQIAHMSIITTGSMDDAQLKAYRDEFTRWGETRVELKDGSAVHLHVPSFDDHVNAGQRWINDIVTMTDRVFGMDQDPDARRAYIAGQGKASILRQYAHWVKWVEMGNASTDPEVRDEEAVSGILDDLSGDDAVRDIFLKGVVDFAEKTTVSFIGVPTVGDEEEKWPRHPHVLPIDAMSTFFILLKQKVPQILTR